MKIFNANSVSKGSLLYLIALPKFSSESAVVEYFLSLSLSPLGGDDAASHQTVRVSYLCLNVGQTKREAVEVAKQLAEGLADQPTITLELYYMLLSQVEYVWQHTHECQMVPTTFFRAFTVRTF